MHKLWMPAAFAVALLFAPLAMAEEAEKADGDEAVKPGVQWIQSYSDALKRAEAENKRIFIEFTATW